MRHFEKLPSEKMDVWGLVFELVGFHPSELQHVMESFHGAAHRCVRQREPIHRLVKVRGRLGDVDRGAAVVRHLGGSAANKILTSGVRFDQGRQLRHAVLLDAPSGTYLLDGLLCVRDRVCTRIFAYDVPALVLEDLIESFILGWSYEQRWLQVHGSGWVADDGAHVLIGDSGVGKTTRLFAALQDGATLLGNDRLFVRASEKSKLEVRGFPLPVNVGFGTIRALGLKLPDFGGRDDDKLRLTPREVVARYRCDYASWYEVKALQVSPPDSWQRNVYIAQDPAHPFWDKATSPRCGGEWASRILAELAKIAAAAPALQTPREKANA